MSFPLPLTPVSPTTTVAVSTTVVVASGESSSTWTVTWWTRHDIVTGSELGHIGSVHTTVEDQDGLSTVSRHDSEITSVSNTVSAGDVLPRAWVSVLSVEEELVVGRVADDNGSVWSTGWGPDSVWTGAGDAASVCAKDVVTDRAELERAVCDLVVGCVWSALVAAGGVGPETNFVRAHPFAVAYLCSCKHTRTLRIVRIGNVVDDWAPCSEVGARLVSELLAVCGVALIRVEDADFVVVGKDEWLPHAGRSVVGVWWTTVCNCRDVLPGVSVLVSLSLGGMMNRTYPLSVLAYNWMLVLEKSPGMRLPERRMVPG